MPPAECAGQLRCLGKRTTVGASLARPADAQRQRINRPVGAAGDRGSPLQENIGRMKTPRRSWRGVAALSKPPPPRFAWRGRWPARAQRGKSGSEGVGGIAPSVSAPSVSAPSVSAPSVSAPSVSKLTAPPRLRAGEPWVRFRYWAQRSARGIPSPRRIRFRWRWRGALR